MDDFHKAEKELKELQQLLLNSRSEARQEIQLKIKQLDFNQETAAMNVLEKTDRNYDLLVQENFDLLVNDQIEFKVIQDLTQKMGMRLN
jgi:hypothetical protein